MHTITFYSFKGGVGRTMALVNTAVEMARRGRSVVLVDFDLEAPGLTTFERLRPPQPHPGVVEYVTEYISTGRSPDIRDYVFKAEVFPDVPGNIYIMPAGREDAHYRRALAKIDWIHLYENLDGFVFFEDTKTQLLAFTNPDYILIDSRTGHTDVEGICTRHLPDSVVVLFFPNEQNLSGLDDVCRAIRGEKHGGLLKDIALHFVMSNVPDLDDEDEILRTRIKSFRSQLHFRKLAATIHHYNSLSLINQSIFVRDRPRSRLAKEYRKLVDELINTNPGDRDGVLVSLEQAAKGVNYLNSEQLSKVQQNFSEDPEVLAAIARVKYGEGRLSDALEIVERVLSSAKDYAEALYYRALIRASMNNKEKAIEDTFVLLNTKNIKSSYIVRLMHILISIDPTRVADAFAAPAVQDLDWESKYEIALDLSRHDLHSNLAVSLFRDVWQSCPQRPERRWSVSHQFSLLLIRSGRWEEAVEVLTPKDHRFKKSQLNELIDNFNLAMARWGRDSSPPAELFRRVMDVARSRSQLVDSANSMQCLAVAAWADGDEVTALEYLGRAIDLAKVSVAPLFSCWRYRDVSPEEFLDDCSEIRRLISGLPVYPAVFGRRE